MKKEWNNPTISETGVQQTKEYVKCPYQPDQPEGVETQCIIPEFPADKCCNCRLYKCCFFSWKYKGACPS